MHNFMTSALNAAPAHRRGAVSGLMTTAIFSGQFLSPLITSPLVVTLGFAGSFQLAAGASLGFALLAGLLLRGR